MQKSKLQGKTQKYFLKFWSIGFIFGLWFIFSFPYFFQHKVPFPSTYQVNHFHPWSDYEKFWGPVKNGAMPDIIDQIYPWKHFTISTLKRGELPLWNPYSFAGNPHLANVQSAALTPFNLLFFILSFIDAWSLLILLQPLLAGLFTYMLLREFRVSRVGRVIGSVAFMFCGFIVAWMAYGTLAMSIVFLPFVLYCIQKATESKKVQWRFLFLLSFSVVVSFFSGHFQISIYFAFYSLLFLTFKFITANKKSTLYAFIFFCIGLLVSLLQILPSVQFYQHAVRSEIFIKGGGIPWYYLVTSFAPDFFGNPVTRNTWFGHYAEWASFIGIIPLLLAFFAVERKNKYFLFFLISGLLSLLFAVDTPLHELLASLKIPVLSTSIPSRIVVLFSFSFSILAGIGFDRLRELIRKSSAVRIITPFIIIGLILIVAWAAIFSGIVPKEGLFVARRNFILPSILFVASAIVVSLAIFRKQLIFILALIFITATSFDSLHFAQKWLPFDPRDLVFPDVPVVQAIKKNIGNGRIFGNIRAQVDTYYEIPSIEGYDPLYIQRYGEFARGAQEGSFIPAERSVVRIDRYGKYVDRLLDLLGVNLIFHPRGDTNQGWAYPVWKNTNRYQRIYQDDKFELYKNTEAMPRAALFYNYKIVKDKEKILRTFYSPDFDFRKKVILEEGIPGFLQQQQEVKGTAEIVYYSPNMIRINVRTSSSAILFLSDNDYPTWKVSVNGKEEKIYRADYTFRAVVIPAGKSVVEFVNRFIL